MKKANKNEIPREDLKALFKNGKIAGEDDFGALIDSMVNKKDDKFSHDNEEGIQISAVENKRYFTFHQEEDEPFFKIGIDKSGNNDNLAFEGVPGKDYTTAKIPTTDLEKPDTAASTLNNNDNNSNPENSIFFHVDGRLGIKKRSEKGVALDVNGVASMHGRKGEMGAVKADKKWYKIVKELNDCHAFEIVARTGMSGSGKFAMLHAIAISTYGRSKSKIRKTSARYGPFWNKIDLRWTGTTHDYALEIRTRSNYCTKKEDVYIYYSLTSLWDDRNMLPDRYFDRKAAPPKTKKLWRW